MAKIFPILTLAAVRPSETLSRKKANKSGHPKKLLRK